MTISPPRYIALCGAPLAGKDEVAQILVNRYGAIQVDTAVPLRRGAMELYGLSWEDVATQEGKRREIEVCGQRYTVRQILGDLGCLLEDKYGSQINPELAVRKCDSLPPAPFYVFSGCRMDQGITYRNHGGHVIEVVRPGFEATHDFDCYDKSLLSYTIVNDGGPEDWHERLTGRVVRLFDSIYGGQ
jgi:hypothetical protein